jgi:Outer membrane lipoprotein carrier protein LolA-like
MLAAAILASSAMELRAAPSDAGNDPSRVDSEWILSKLVQPAPARTSFVELRGSKLLKKPLRLQGEYLRPDADTLVRKVAAPYAETTTIRAGEVEIARAGKSPRRFSLSRVPEMAGLQSSFGALLSGDRRALEQRYALHTQGTRQRWTMTLTPKDAAMRKKIQTITLYGRGSELRCIETQPTEADAQRTLLAGAARAAEGVTGAGALATLCYGGAKPAAPTANEAAAQTPPRP